MNPDCRTSGYVNSPLLLVCPPSLSQPGEPAPLPSRLGHRRVERHRRRGEVDHVLLAVPPYPTNSMPYRRASAANCSMSGCPTGEALVRAAASSK